VSLSVKKKYISPITVGFVALGCPKNLVDAEKMLGIIAEAGLVISADIDNADVVVINTCGFIAPAKTEAVEAITFAVANKKKGRVKKVIVAGCLSERMGETLAEEVEGIDAIIGLEQRDRIAEIIKHSIAGDKGSLYLSEKNTTQIIQDDRGRVLISPAHWAYLRISEGCNRKCSFCTIPSIKGPFRSKPLEMVIAEAEELVENGAVELSLIAQDSSYYGRDLKIKNGLVKLLTHLEQIKKLKWIRLMYLYPTGIDNILIETISQSKKILNYIDMPIQHINNKILRDMQRAETKEKIVGLIEKLRTAMPDVIIRTTVIVGFPGESDEQFEELLEFIKWAKFDALGCFTYYREEGTISAQMSGQVAEKAKEKRMEKLMLTQQQIAFAKNREKIGAELLCLIDENNGDKPAQGRYYAQAPHIDSLCFITNCKAKRGEFINAKVAGTENYDLILEQA
jgi:ribosomal protein S12 methylthiotransferase